MATVLDIARSIALGGWREAREHCSREIEKWKPSTI